MSNGCGATHPLNRLLKKSEPDRFELEEEQLRRFWSFIDRVCSLPWFSFSILDLTYSIGTDACDYVIGCTIFQTHPYGEREPLGYWSRTLTTPERNYSAFECECVVVVFALKKLRPYLMHETVLVHSNHHVIHWMCTITEPSARLTRWRLILAECTFSKAYKKGKDNHHADMM